MKFLLPLLGLSYVFSPYDLFPDFFLGVGWIDDLLVLGLLWWYIYVYRKRRYAYQGQNQEGKEASGGPGTKDATEQRDPYLVLGLSRGASPKEIKEAYRRLASQYHPDKVMHLGEEFRELAEARFKEIQSAYQQLTAK